MFHLPVGKKNKQLLTKLVLCVIYILNNSDVKGEKKWTNNVMLSILTNKKNLT